MDFKRLPGKFTYSGMDIHHPLDLLPPDKCSLLFNLQPDTQAGALVMRPPITQLAATAAGAPIHSIARLNDSVPSAANPFSRFIGSGVSIYSGAGSPLTLIENGYSGNPLAMVPYRPQQSPESWLYVYDSAQQRRYKTDQTAQNIGVAAPVSEPSAVRIQPLYKLLCSTESAAAWTGIDAVAGTIGSLSAVARVPAAATVSIIVYDSGSTGMACVSPAAANYAWMTSGAGIIIGSEQVYIEEIFPPLAAATVGSIAYDSGSTGLCTIVPSVALPGLRRNQLLTLNSISNVRVLSVVAAPDGTYSFRCNTGATTITAGQTISSPPNFRVWTSGTHVASAAITGNAIQATLTPTLTGGSMSAVMNSTAAVDLTQISSRPITNEDYIHVGLLFDNPQYVTEVHLMLDVGDGSFTGNFFYYVLRQSDFQQSSLGGPAPGAVQTVQAQLSAIEYGVAEQLAPEVLPSTAQPPYPTPQVPDFSSPDPQILGVGQSIWTDVMLHVSDLTKVGTNNTLGLFSVVAVGILIYVNGGVVHAQVANPYVSGGYGPDCNFNTYGAQAPPIQWRYRYRNSLTGAHSTVSPETRNGETLRRQGIDLTCPTSADTQVDTIDWERRGGTNPDWHYVGSVPQGTTFLDSVTENAAQIGDPLEVTSYQPWPVTDLPRIGTALVTGTNIVWQSGDTFNLRWLRGTEFIIGGNTYSLYAPPSSSTMLTLAQSVPVTGVYTFSIPEATIEGRPLYGAWLDEANNRVCAVGDPLNPGLMYFSNNDNPDGASDAGYIEITSPSEPLLNGFYAEGANYVFTSSSLYRVDSAQGSVNPYVSHRLSGVEGMAGPWAFDAQRRLLFWWGPDGVYVYAFGAVADSLTANDLYPLFPHAGLPGQQGIPGLPISIAGQTIYPPNYSRPSLLRMGCIESFVYATYPNTAGAFETLVYSLTAKGWRKDTYTPNAFLFVLEKGVPNPLLMVGGADGNLYQVDPAGAAIADTGGAIDWVVLPPSKDAGDSRAVKQWGDLLLDYNCPSAVSSQVLWDNLLVTGPALMIPLTAQRSHQIVDLFTPPDTNDTPALIHYNVSVLLSGAGPVFLYEWQPSFAPLPEDTTSRVGDWQIGGSAGFKWINGVVIHADTYGQPKQIQIEYDNQAISIMLIINHNGEQRLPYYFPPVYAHELRILPLDDVLWHDWHDEEWIGNPEPEYGAALAVNWLNGGTRHYKFVQGIRLHADTFGRAKQLQIQYEGGINGPVFEAVHNGEQTLPYSWSPPFKAHLMRIIPLDNNPWRYWVDTEWIYTLEPEPANYWISQPTSFDMQGFLHIRELWVAYAGVQGGAISVSIDGGAAVPIAALPGSATPSKSYSPCPPLKGKLWQLSASGTGLQLYERDTEFLVKSWGDTGPYQRLRPFGDTSAGGGVSAARI